jgi:hypothetical protein
MLEKSLFHFLETYSINLVRNISPFSPLLKNPLLWPIKLSWWSLIMTTLLIKKPWESECGRRAWPTWPGEKLHPGSQGAWKSPGSYKNSSERQCTGHAGTQVYSHTILSRHIVVDCHIYQFASSFLNGEKNPFHWVQNSSGINCINC